MYIEETMRKNLAATREWDGEILYGIRENWDETRNGIGIFPVSSIDFITVSSISFFLGFPLIHSQLLYFK